MAGLAGVAVLAIGIPLAMGIGGTGDEPEGRQLEPSGVTNLVSQGSTGDLMWRVVSYDSNVGLCLDLIVSGAINSSGGACGFPVPAQDWVGISTEHFYTVDQTFVYGPVREGVESVLIETTGAQTLRVDPAAGPASVEGLDFYVVQIPGIVEIASVVAQGAAGQVLDRVLTDGPAVPPVPGELGQ